MLGWNLMDGLVEWIGRRWIGRRQSSALCIKGVLILETYPFSLRWFRRIVFWK